MTEKDQQAPEKDQQAPIRVPSILRRDFGSTRGEHVTSPDREAADGWDARNWHRLPS